MHLESWRWIWTGKPGGGNGPKRGAIGVGGSAGIYERVLILQNEPEAEEVIAAN